MTTRVLYFRSPADWREWLETNHATAREVRVGFYKKRSGKPSITWPESVAEALCHGWIDGIRHRLDEDRYTIRFTPRKRGSTWSAVNIRMAKELEAAGRMTAAGRTAFQARVEARSRVYSYEQNGVGLDPVRLKALKRNKAAWAFFEAQPPGYRKMVLHWVMQAKTEDTRDRRFGRLVESLTAGKRLT